MEEFKAYRQRKKMEKIERLRKRNDALRKKGKDPLAGWNPVVNTGSGGLNKITVATGKGTIDLTGNNNETRNFFSDEQKKMGKK